MKKMKYLVLLIASIFAIETNGQIVPSKLFASGMVLQREQDIPVWGKASVGETITVSIETDTDTISNSGVVDVNGKWKVVLSSIQAGGPFKMRIEGSSSSELLFTDVYIGDVWLCSGQSNMEMTVISATGASATISAANNQRIRQFKVEKSAGKVPVENLTSGTWTPATSSFVGNFSAAAYYFAKHIFTEIDSIPIGLLNISYGGSRLEAWMSDEMLGYDENDIRLAKGETERQPTLIYNCMINPIIGVPMKGILWYQGESNADNMQDAQVYGELFRDYIKGYRQLWNNPDLPVIWVQLPNEGDVDVETAPDPWDAWPQIRANQSRVLSVSNTAEVVTIDVGEVDIHPKDKESVGARLALAVRKLVYNQSVVADGPRYLSHSVLAKDKVKINFTGIASGLVASRTSDSLLHWFTYQDAAGVLRSAIAKIQSDNSVIVTNSRNDSMVLIRYAWEYNPVGVNFYNSENLPAAPFKFNVNFEGFKLTDFSFDNNVSVIERGKSALLNWTVSGAQKVLLNGVEVDSLGKAQVWPMDTITYTLQIINKDDITDTIKQSLILNVKDPIPTITVYAKSGKATPPDSDVILIADAAAPGGGTVTKVKFFVDGVLLATVTEAPYQTIWSSSELGTYTITGVVTNEKGVSTTSLEYIMFVSDVQYIRFEAENAVLTGSGLKVNSSVASGGKYVSLKDVWTITFNVNVPANGTYQVNFRYLLNYESPKEENLLINGVSLGAIRFEAPDNATWMDMGMELELVAGANTIQFTPSWGWMSFDYIEVLGATTKVKEVEQSDVTLKVTKTRNKYIIEYSVVEEGTALIEVFDSAGKKVKTLLNEVVAAGDGQVVCDSNALLSGTYIVSLKQNGSVVSKKIVVK